MALPTRIIAGPYLMSRLRSISFSRKKEDFDDAIAFFVDPGEIPGINEKTLVISVLKDEVCPEIGKEYGDGWIVRSYVYKDDGRTVNYALCCK